MNLIKLKFLNILNVHLTIMTIINLNLLIKYCLTLVFFHTVYNKSRFKFTWLNFIKHFLITFRFSHIHINDWKFKMYLIMKSMLKFILKAQYFLWFTKCQANLYIILTCCYYYMEFLFIYNRYSQNLKLSYMTW